MLIRPFHLEPHNSYYEGEYSTKEMEWRRVCAMDKARNLQSLLNGLPVETVLEVGCGTGAVLTEVARRGIGVRHVGVDMAEPALHADLNAGNMDLIKYDGRRLPFDDSSFDLVYSSHVVEHVPDPRGFIAELIRVSKKAIYIEVPCEMHARASRDSLQATLTIGHINPYCPESFLLLLQTAGLMVEDMQLFDHSIEVQQFHTTPIKGRLKKFVRGIVLRSNPILASRLFTYHCGALCVPQRPQ